MLTEQETTMEPQGLDVWAVVEIMGHQTVAGRVTEQVIAGAAMLRIDVPEVPESPATRYSSGRPAVPGYTRYFGNQAVYSITPCSEEMARSAAAKLRSDPVAVYTPLPVAEPLRALPAELTEDDDDGNFYPEGVYGDDEDDEIKSGRMWE